jgi:hypothetical protein
MKCTYIESKPRVCSAQQNFAVLPLGEVSSEIGPGSLGRLCTLDHGIRVDNKGTGSQDVLNILCGLLNIALDIHGETRSFWDGQTEVEGNTARNAAKTNKDTPQVVDVVENGGVVT